MSVGVNLLFKLVKEAAEILGTNYDAEVIEMLIIAKTVMRASKIAVIFLTILNYLLFILRNKSLQKAHIRVFR